MNIRFDKKLQKELLTISKHNPKLLKLIEKQIELFAKDPTHQSLRIHKLSGELKNLWSISVNRSLRIIYFLEDDGAYFIDIGSHDEVYKK